MKKIHFLLLLLSTPAIAQKNHTVAPVRYELRGVATYFFNDNFGDKPDVGTKAYIIKPAVFTALGATALKYALYDLKYEEFKLASMAAQSEATSEEVAKTKEFASLDTDIARINAAIIAHPQTVIVTANGEGVFLKKLNPGKYCVLMVSAHQHHDTKAERFASMHLEEVNIKSDDVEVSAKFDL